MSSAGSNPGGVRWPDVAVGVGCVLLILALVWIAFGDRPGPRVDHDTLIQQQLRSIHQAMLLYGFDNGNYLPGLNPDGSLLTNDPATRYDLLVDSNLLAPADLVSPADVRSAAKYSYAILDISVPGARRDAWTTEPVPTAPILAESLESKGLAESKSTHDDKDPDSKPGSSSGGGGEGWSGWVLWHRPYLTPETAALLTEHHESPQLRAGYIDTGPLNESDELFSFRGPDDAFLVSK